MAYYRETAPLIGYYFCKGKLRTVDGMAPIDEVAAAIDERPRRSVRADGECRQASLPG